MSALLTGVTLQKGEGAPGRSLRHDRGGSPSRSSPSEVFGAMKPKPLSLCHFFTVPETSDHVHRHRPDLPAGENAAEPRMRAPSRRTPGSMRGSSGLARCSLLGSSTLEGSRSRVAFSSHCLLSPISDACAVAPSPSSSLAPSPRSSSPPADGCSSARVSSSDRSACNQRAHCQAESNVIMTPAPLCRYDRGIRPPDGARAKRKGDE